MVSPCRWDRCLQRWGQVVPLSSLNPMGHSHLLKATATDSLCNNHRSRCKDGECLLASNRPANNLDNQVDNLRIHMGSSE